MGLDMYMLASRSINEEDTELLAKKYAFPSTTSASIEVEAAYWRKCNAIHHWFVNNVQNGTDDCGKYYVGRSDLETLLETIYTVLKDQSKAEELLPTESGFFFGSTEYNEYYFSDLEYTADTINQLLDEKYKDWDFHYQSSW